VSLPQRHAGTALLADLVSPAIFECLSGLDREEARRTPVLLGISHPSRAGRPEDVERMLLAEISDRLGFPVSAESRTFAGDQAGCGFAVLDAYRLITERRAARVVVAGVDTLLDRPVINALSDARRLLTPTNFNGFLPGEAGSAVLLGGSADERGAALRIAGIGHALEEATITATTPLRGAGLVAAIRGALRAAGLVMADVDYRITDLSGEHYKFKEAMFALVRLDHASRSLPLELWHPIEFLGEIGAAILPCLLAWARHAGGGGYAPGARALLHLGSDDGHRFAIVTESVTPGAS
jgi:3-oxoacyl-[acyl-carrier-protein] synthase-1